MASVPRTLAEVEQRNGTYEGASLGISTPWAPWACGPSLSSFFPVGRRYPFMPPEAETDGWKYVAFIQRGQERRIPFQVTLLDNSGRCRLNMACSIDDFQWKVKRNGDLAYSPDLPGIQIHSGVRAWAAHTWMTTAFPVPGRAVEGHHGMGGQPGRPG